MNRIAYRLAVAGLVAVAACDKNDVLTLGSTYTLQGIVADAVTGKRLGDDLKLYLVQGPEVRGPSRLISNTQDPLAGEYAFTGIPVSYSSGGEAGATATWKVIAIKSNYQRFESEITFSAGLISSGSGTTVDQAFSRIGNIYLFPTGVSAPDYNFTVTYNGKPVPGATIVLNPLVASNTQIFTTGGASDTLAAHNGYVPSLTSTPTDAAGKTTFAGTLLSVGAAYKIQVLPVAFKEPTSGTTVQLGLVNLPTSAPPAGIPMLLAGLSTTTQPLFLGDLTPATTTEPLFIADASNRALDQIQSNGTLVITFNTPVTLVNPNGFGATFSPGTKADGTTAGTGALNTTQPVTASLSADGLTLTLAPNYTGSGGQAPGATDRNVSIHYTEGAGATPAMVVPKDYPTKQFSVLSPPPGSLTPLKFSDGTTGETGFVVISGP